MTRYLLDTDFIVEFLRGTRGAAAREILSDAILQNETETSIVNVAEVEFGILRSERNREQRVLLDAFLTQVEILPFDMASVSRYAEIRTALERAGTPIGPLDTLIAAIALAHDATLVTNNTREFARVPGLRIDNWLEPFSAG